MRERPENPWNRLRLPLEGPPSRGHVESYFVKASSPSGERALWVRFTLLALEPARAARGAGGPYLEVWAVLFDRARGAPLAAKERHLLSAASIDPARPRIEVAGCLFEPGRTRGRIRAAEGAAEIAWDLRWGTASEPLPLLPSRLLYESPFPSSKVVSPVPDASFVGVVQVEVQGKEQVQGDRWAGAEWEVMGWPGMQGHNWGRRHALRYAWVHGNAFAGAPGAVFEAASASVPLGPLATPLLTTALLRWGGRERDFRGVSSWWNPSAEIEAGARLVYRVGLESATARVIARVEAASVEAAHLRYEDPDGALALCRNAKTARMTLDVATRSGGGRPFEEAARLEGPAALEVLTRE